MIKENNDLNELIKARNVLAIKERELYLRTAEKINIEMKSYLTNDFGFMLVKNIGRDLAGEVVRRYFDLSDYYITVDQLYDRFVHFSYDDDIDYLINDENIRKSYYNYTDGFDSATLKDICATCNNAQKQLFDSNRAEDSLDAKGKAAYRSSRTTADGKIYDELTNEQGNSNVIIKNGKEVRVSDLQADHIQARETIKYNERYLREDKIEKLKEFYNSKDNMQMMHASANSSKGDVRICENGKGEIEYLNAKEMKSRQSKGEALSDISYKATVEQLAEATISQWEKDTKSGDKLKTLKEKGYLDENGKVKDSVKKELILNIKNSQNKESIEFLKDANYKQISKDAFTKTRKSMNKIIAGQMLYYVLPPLIFETQAILKCKNMTLDKFMKELKKSRNRIIKYVSNKMGEILKKISGNALNKFLKTFFDIIIEMLKATVKRLFKIIKDLVLSFVNCGRVLLDKNATAGQRADAITKILSTTITTIVLELMFEYLEKQFSIPDFLMEPLQMIVTILSTNIIMLVLNKLDLFNVQYGLLVSNIEGLLENSINEFSSTGAELVKLHKEEYEKGMKIIELQIHELTKSIHELNVYQHDALPFLDDINKIFNMNIDFDYEWKAYLNAI